MKCCACGSQRIGADMSRCPECGFPLVHTVGTGEDSDGRMEKLAGEYRQKKLGPISLSLQSYRYKREGEQLKPGEMEEVFLTDRVCDLSPGEILWKGEKFAHIDGGEPLNVTLLIDREGERRREALPMTAPAAEGFWQVGIMMETGFAVRVVVGNAASHSCSDKTPLI